MTWSLSTKKISIGTYWLTLIAFAVLAILSVVMFLLFDEIRYPKLAVILGGFSVGFVVAFIQLATSIYEGIELSRYQKLGVKNVLSERSDRAYYKSLIDNATQQIVVVGVTASRFLEDFASDSNADTRSLINALSRGVYVKILVPCSEHLEPVDAAKFNHARTIADKLHGQFPDFFSLKTFDHKPCHSIFLCDSTCIVGPVFKGLDSKFTPAIVLDRESTFAVKYMNYFEKEWDSSESLF